MRALSASRGRRRFRDDRRGRASDAQGDADDRGQTPLRRRDLYERDVVRDRAPQCLGERGGQPPICVENTVSGKTPASRLPSVQADTGEHGFGAQRERTGALWRVDEQMRRVE